MSRLVSFLWQKISSRLVFVAENLVSSRLAKFRLATTPTETLITTVEYLVGGYNLVNIATVPVHIVLEYS